jgi:hypothetical protein
MPCTYNAMVRGGERMLVDGGGLSADGGWRAGGMRGDGGGLGKGGLRAAGIRDKGF